mgnify:CR=1 FL=1
MNTEEKNQLSNQVQTDVSLISFLSVISVFFIGALLPQFNSYDPSVGIPIAFLVVSTFAFIFSALILSNATQVINKGDIKKTEKYLSYGYALSEYMGVFLSVLAVPVAMSIVTADLYLRVITFLAAIAGISIYQFCGFSLLKNHFSKSETLFGVLVVLFGIILFLSQLFDFYFTGISTLFLLFMVVLTILAPMKSVQ